MRLVQVRKWNLHLFWHIFPYKKNRGPAQKRCPSRIAKIKTGNLNHKNKYPFGWLRPWTFTWPFGKVILQGIHISHLGKRKIIFKIPFWGDMLVPWRVYILRDLQGFFYGTKNLDHGDLAVKSPVISGSDSPKVWNSCRSLSRCAWKFDPLHGNSRSSMLFGNHDGSMGSKGTFT